MSNKYIHTLRSKEGSSNLSFLDDLISNVSGGQFSSGNDLVTTVKTHTKTQTKRMDKITELSESNMKILEKDLELLEDVLKTYNVVGYLAGTTALLGSVLLGIKLKKHYDRKRFMR